MAKHTKTTRNTDFNYYLEKIGDDEFANSVTSMTATVKNPNIKLLNINDAIKVKGSDIMFEALKNTTLIEVNIGLDAKTAKLAAYYATTGEPTDSNGKTIYNTIKEVLNNNISSFEKVKKMVINTNIDASDAQNDYYIFGAPYQVVLNNRQNYNNCGVESTLNTLATAGIIKMKENLKDQKSTEKKFLNRMVTLGLVDDSGSIGGLDEPDGGTLPDDYRDILNLYGIESESYYITNYHNESDKQQYNDLNEFAYKISQGHGAIVGVCSSILWNETQSESGEIGVDHAIAVIGVVYDKDSPISTNDETSDIIYNTPVGFYIHDSGCWMTRYISFEEFKEATLYDYTYAETSDMENKKLSTLSERDENDGTLKTKDSRGFFVTVTTNPIKWDMYNLNATGDKFDNILYGNREDNVIKGNGGNDTLYGGAGNDIIYGGKGNDIIFGSGSDLVDIQELSKVVNNITINVNNITINNKKVEIFDNTINGINTLYGDIGNDIIFGGSESDLIYGGKGNDYIYGAEGRDAIYGGKGNDIIAGGGGDDRLFGDAGNDTIYGGFGTDTINGGAGNDKIYGGAGSDRIETGKGNDTVFIEGTKHGIDVISSKGGSAKIKFTDGEGDDKAALIKNVNMCISKDEDNFKKFDFELVYIKDADKAEHGISFDSFFNSKTNKFKNVILEDSEKTYKLSASKSKKAAVANTSTKETNKNINNIFFSTYTKGATIKTSAKDDIIYMLESDEFNEDYKKETAIDNITYTGGNDKYVSKERNTYYSVSSFNKDTNLMIYDNVEALVKKELDIETLNMKTMENIVSTDDRLYINSNADKLTFLFDVNTSGKATDNSGLFIFESDSLTNDKLALAAKNSDTTGVIYMDSFFTKNEAFSTSTAENTFLFGNGRIEKVFCNNVEYKKGEGESAVGFEGNLANIASSVAGWLNDATKNTGSYDSAFAALSGNQGDINSLIACYTGTNA